jgi:hypothetical protein
LSSTILRRAVLVVVLLATCTAATGKLAFQTLDVFVRHADLIVVAKTTRLIPGSTPLAIVAPSEVLLGTITKPSLRVVNAEPAKEDAAVFSVGTVSLLFLRRVGGQGYGCVNASDGKIDFRAAELEHWNALLSRTHDLIRVRQAPSTEDKERILLELLDSRDLWLVAAASSYLNFLVNDADIEPWVILPPADSGHWSWRDYFDRNAQAHRELWKAWAKTHKQQT